MAPLSAVETISPGLAVPEASTTSLVLPADGGLKGAPPEAPPARSHGFGGGPLAANGNPSSASAIQLRSNHTNLLSQHFH